MKQDLTEIAGRAICGIIKMSVPFMVWCGFLIWSMIKVDWIGIICFGALTLASVFGILTVALIGYADQKEYEENRS